MRIILFSTFLFLSFNVNADMVGGDVAYLSQLFIKAKEQLKTLRDNLDEIKTTNDTLKNSMNLMNDMKKEYDFWQDFNLNAHVDDVKRHYLNGTLIDELIETDDNYARFELTRAIANRRTKAIDPQGNNLPDTVLGPTESDDYLLNVSLSDSYLDVSDSVLNDDLSTKDIQRINASSTAILASEALDRKARRIKDEIRRREITLDMLDRERDFMNYLKGE